MTTVSFPHWKEALAAAELPSRSRKSFEISIQWYLGYLARHKQPASVESARAFVGELIAERKPADWMVEQWREGLNWFFRHAPQRRHRSEAAEATGDGRRHYPVTVREYQGAVPQEPWIEETVRLLRVRHMAYRTEETYIGWLRRFDRFAGGREKSLDEVGEEDLKDFLSHLAVEEGISASTQRQALNAGVFFLREVRKMELGDFSDFVKADPRKYYPVVYSRGEIRRVLENLRDTWQLMARLQYGCGLRVSELCRLRIKDVDVERGKLYVRAGKGEKDRVVPLPRSLDEDWRCHLERCRRLHEKDRADKQPGVFMPDGLGRKFRRADTSWEWFWAFPARDLSGDPREPTAPPRRHHVLPGVYQRHLTDAVRRAGLAKRSNSHILRHSFATHLLESGVNIRTVQECLGHTCVETTMIYLHVMQDEAERLVSPLDNLAA